MKIHANAALTPRQRRRLCLLAARTSITAAADRVGCSRQTASKWVNRGLRGEPMTDRSSRPHHSPRQTPASVEQVVLRARRELEAGPHVIGWATGLAASTVYRILVRHGCQHLQPPPRREPIIRYQRERPGELIHIDCKKLGRILQPGHRVTGDRSKRAKGKAGFHYLFVAIDDATRLGYAQLYPAETSDAAISFLAACIHFYGQHDITIQRVLTDNGTCFKHRWNQACHDHNIKPKRTRTYRPQTNGKAERFIRTLIERWAYARTYPTETDRADALPDALTTYNRYRPHRALGGLTPLQRVNNLAETNT
jgi:transposase InsO family protein